MLRLMLLLVASSFTVSCSSDNDTADTEVFLDEVIGLWNSSENVSGKSDVIYTRITSEGAVIEYDFDGDEVDQGLSCYHIKSGSTKVISGNRYLVTADMHDKQFEVELELLDAGHALKILFMDESDKSKVVKSQIWTRESDASILDEEPACK